MATAPAFLRNGTRGRNLSPVKQERDPFQLRGLPHEDVFFYSKKIDNSRLVREDDPKGRGACWSAIGAACVILALVTSVLVPSVASTLAGYKLESLRSEQQRLTNERRFLDLQEAELLSPDRLEALAKQHNLTIPASGQVVRLEGKPDGTVAMAK